MVRFGASRRKYDSVRYGAQERSASRIDQGKSDRTMLEPRATHSIQVKTKLASFSEQEQQHALRTFTVLAGPVVLVVGVLVREDEPCG